MNKRKKLPIGIESFEEMRKEDFYYVDKTRWIEQLLAQWGKVNLFTRPRRFGKSLNMSMLQTFFEVGADASLFDGLYISKNKEVCKQYLGKFPVVSISLKGVIISTHFTATLGIPLTSPALEPDSFQCSPRVKPWVFTSDLPCRLRSLYTQ